MSNYQNYNFYT